MHDLLPERLRDELVAIIEVSFEFTEEPKDHDFWSDMSVLFTRSHTESSARKTFIGQVRLERDATSDRTIGYRIEEIQERLDRYWPKQMRSAITNLKVFDVLVGLRYQSKGA